MNKSTNNSHRSKSKFKSNLDQLGLLTWKNYKLQTRSIISLIVELTLPAFLAIILIPLRTIIKSEFYDAQEYSAFNLSKFPQKNDSSPPSSITLYYQPNNSEIQELMNIIYRDLGFIDKPIGN